jgi:nucleoside-diphosphate-sugar epimerase
MGRILVTGASGFLGRHLTPVLSARHEIFVLARAIPSDTGNSNISWILQDLLQPLDPARLPESIDTIIYLAQSRFHRQFPEKAADIFDVNVRGVFNLLEYGRQAGCKLFIDGASGGVYEYGARGLSETDRVSPANFFLGSKYCGELLVAGYQSFFTTIVLRFFFLYGPGQEGMLIPILLRKVLHEEPITIENRPGLRINPIYVDDAVRAVEAALDLSSSSLINIAGDEVISITDLVALMEETTGRRVKLQYRAAENRGDLIGDNARMKQELKISPRVTLREGLTRILGQISDFELASQP